MLLLAVDPDDGGLAVAFRLVRQEQHDREGADVPPDLGAGVGELREVALEAPGERIVDDRRDRDLAQWRVDPLAGLGPGFVDERQSALDVHVPLPAISLGRSGETRNDRYSCIHRPNPPAGPSDPRPLAFEAPQRSEEHTSE